MIRSAVFSECRTWRYTLERMWDADKPRILFVLLNPSTADETKDDPTNRRGITFARWWGFGSCVFVNLFAFRTPDPKEMKKARDPVGPDNDLQIERQACRADRVVFAWGTAGSFMRRDQAVIELLNWATTYDMGLTKHGHPKHPLYLPSSTELRLRT